MSRGTTLSALGLYQWDNTLFDLMTIPEELSKDTLVDNLLAETAELEILYPNPVVLKNLIGVWSSKQIDVWNKLYATTQFEYNPIENYNRYETGSEDGEGRTTHSGSDSKTDATTYGGTDRRTRGTTDGGSDTFTGADEKGHWIAGFDSTASGTDDGLVKQTRDMDNNTSTTQYGKTESVTEALQHGQTIYNTGSFTHGEQITTTKEGEHELHAHGNIGVMSTQDMIQQERQIDRFNIYDIIIEDFKMRFCILIY